MDVAKPGARFLNPLLAGRILARPHGTSVAPDRFTPGETPQAAPAPPSFDRRRIESVFVIGAGPGGLASAIKLAERGIKVTVVEARSDHYQRPHHLNLRQGALDSLADLGALDSVMERSGWIIAEEHKGETIYPSTREADKDRVSGDPFTMLSSDSVVQVRIADVERALYDRARELGVKFEFHTKARLHEIVKGDDADKYRVELQGVDDNLEPVGPVRDMGVPDLVIACDGANSETRRQLGIAFIEESEPRYYLGGHVEKDFGPFTRKMERPMPDGFVQRLMVTGHAKYPSAWVSVQVQDPLEDLTPDQRVALLCESASAVMGTRIEPRDIVWGGGQVTRVQDRRAEVAYAGLNVVLLGDAARTGDVWASGGLNLSLVTDVQNLCRMVDEVNRGSYGMYDGLVRYHLRTRWASKVWHIVASDQKNP